MTPAEARDALSRAFPGMEWRPSDRGPDCIVGQREAVTVLVRVTRGAQFLPYVAAVADSGADAAEADDPVDAVCSALWHARAYLAAVDAALIPNRARPTRALTTENHMSAIYLIKCNECGEIAKDTSTVGLQMARSHNRSHGWTNPKPGFDYCPECSKKRKASGAAYY